MEPGWSPQGLPCPHAPGAGASALRSQGVHLASSGADTLPEGTCDLE